MEDIMELLSKTLLWDDLPLSQVLVTDHYCSNALQKEISYLLSFSTKRLLSGFYETAGLTTDASRYPGWESSLIGGHTLGHYLTAVAQASVNPGASPKDKETLLEKLHVLVDGLQFCQQHSQGEPGFIFGATLLDPKQVELQFDHVEQNRTNIVNEAWVPWYTMHKLLAGLADVYEITGYEPAKAVLIGLADWVLARTRHWSDEVQATVLGIEYGGMNDCMYEVYKITGTADYAWAAHKFDEESLFAAVHSGQKNVLNNRHANTTIPKFLGALNRYLALGSKEQIYLDYAECFWQMVVERHTYITGGNSEWEHFGEDFVLNAERTNCNCETCNTYNMLKLSHKLFLITGNPKYLNYYEKTLTNAILSSQNPETGMSMYFQPMATGYFKVYGTPFDKFWCCTGSGMENFTKLGDSIYYRKNNTIVVGQYRSCVLTLPDIGLELLQEANLLSSEEVRFTLHIKEKTPVELCLWFRIPDWAVKEPVVCADAGIQVARSGEFLIASGLFSDGTVLKLKIPFGLSAANLPDGKNVYAFSYGPFLLSAELGTDHLEESVTGVIVTIPTRQTPEEPIVISSKQETVEEFMQNLSRHLLKEPDRPVFHLTGTSLPLTFSPHFMQHQQRYGIYWEFKVSTVNSSASTSVSGQQNEYTVIDTVQPGYGQYESDAKHQLQTINSVGQTQCGTCRYANAGGRFSYRLELAAEQVTWLKLTLSSRDNGRPLKITAGQTVIYEERVHLSEETEFQELLLPIPESEVENAVKDKDYGLLLTFCFEGNPLEPSAAIYQFLSTCKKKL